jgi:hypothetical protein
MKIKRNENVIKTKFHINPLAGRYLQQEKEGMPE